MQLSASQIGNFLACPRLWYYKSVAKIKEPDKECFKIGKRFHWCVEDSYELALDKPMKRKWHGDEDLEMVTIGWDKDILYLPKTFKCEQYIKFQVDEDTKMIGYIDMLDISNGKIIDHKTLSMWRYAETPETLKDNLQLMIYAYWYLSKLEDKDGVWLRHNQFFKPDPYQSKFEEVFVTRKEVMDYYEKKVLAAVKFMKKFKEKAVETVPCNVKSCDKYTGCYMFDECSKRN